MWQLSRTALKPMRLISSNLLKIVMADRDDSVPDPASERPGIPQFTARDLHELMENELSEGSCGTVYSLKGFPGLAVKEIRIDGQNSNVTRAIGFEIAVLIKLSHPNIIKYHQVIEDGDLVYVIMDRYSGSLDRFITRCIRAHEPIPVEKLLSILEQIISALVYLHSAHGVDANGDLYQGVVHRDLKPANILVSEDGNRIVLADFELCKNALRNGSTVAGTLAYMAPETLINGMTSQASDVWALGIIIYELAVLKKPLFWQGRDPKDVFVPGWKPDLSAVTSDFIRETLEKIFVLDPGERPTAKDLANLFMSSSIVITGLHSQVHILTNKCSSLEAALSDASAKIASLEGELKAKSTKIETLEKQYKNLSKIVEQHQKQFAKVNENLGQELAQKPRASTNSSNIKLIKLNRAHRGATTQQYSFIPVQDSSWTPLMCAAFTGDIEAAKKHLVDTDKKNSDGDTALMIAAKAGHADIVELLDPTDEKRVTALMRAVIERNTEMVELLAPLQKELKDKDGNTALMLSAMEGRADVVELLDPTDEDGVTALMRAAERNDVEAVRALIPLQAGQRTSGKVRVKDCEVSNQTALMRAASSGHAGVVELLVEHESGMQDSEGWTALMRAAESNHSDCASLLVDKEARKQNKYGSTALIYAAYNDNADCIKILLRDEAHMYDNKGWSALAYAARNNNVESARLLAKKEKALRTTREWDGFPSGSTALNIAMQQGHNEIVDILLNY
ncbi:Kinase/ NEK [Giardia duodenalis assemblage B]|uniref:Kinase/ NEK n=1 Tax=Giardia duodenalis assemblage B TaxID=1394984 RepID=A0A132NTH9_GIAIN|nr:Kinase/ NEK [Giardia intestinalis assemblage B]